MTIKSLYLMFIIYRILNSVIYKLSPEIASYKKIELVKVKIKITHSKYEIT